MVEEAGTAPGAVDRQASRALPVHSGLGDRGRVGALGYELDAGLDDEGYTPATYGPFLELPAQFARFRQSDSLVMAAATDLGDIPLGTSRTVLVASDAPDSWPVVLGPMSGRARPVFAATLDPEPVVISIEAMGDNRAVGRARRGFHPLADNGLVQSDVLLLDASDAELPEVRPPDGTCAGHLQARCGRLRIEDRCVGRDGRVATTIRTFRLVE